MTEYKVSFRYAKALLNSALNENVEDVIFDDFQKIKSIIKSSNKLLVFIGSPIYQLYKKKQVLKEVFQDIGQVSDLTFAFLMLLIDKRRGNLLPDIIAQYENSYNKNKGRLPIEIKSAVEIKENVRSGLKEKLADWTGKTILANYQTDEKLIGGMTIRIDDWVFDSSIKNQLIKIRKALVEGKEINN